jgi:predicted dithiol-disulfide oxidoreductase (DUF899 family)
VVANHKVVSHDEWLAARKEHLAKEKEFTRLRDQLSQQRCDLPWERVEKEYIFEAGERKESLSQLFAGRSQLIVYHFMFHPSWNEGCPSCSFWADNFNGIIVHLNHRDVTMVAVSKAPIEKLEDYKKRMGWTFKWVSSLDTDFNCDYQVSDNLSAHKTSKVEEFLARHPNVHLHFTPTYSSWLNQVELWFAKVQRDVIARGIFTSIKDLDKKLMRYIR